MSSNAAHRPATISELAERARNHTDDKSTIKGYLRLADQLRRDGKEQAERNDLEGAFVAFARAATIVLEKIPNHREYSEVLKPAQRNNLAMVRSL
jgi:STAM-binding protein